jgi:hypothetical protein
MTVRRAAITRIYLPGGRVAHLTFDTGRMALCENHLGMGDPRFHESDEWHGTGTQDEIEKAARMPLHQKCAEILAALYGSPESTGTAIGPPQRPQLEAGS